MVGVEMLVSGWFASPVIKSVLQKAQNYLGANYELQKGTEEIVEELTNTLLLCQATVTEAEKGAIINNPALGEWLRSLKETVYDAEDVLDNIEAKSIKEKVQGRNKVSKFASSSVSAVSTMFSPDDKTKSLKYVVDKLKKLSVDIPKFLKLINMNNKNELQTSEVTDPRETISEPLEEVGLYGRQDELNLILDIILGSESESSKKGGLNYKNYHGLLVIPIVGMGGVGKTALAQAVYNNPEVQQTFASKAWISVSNKPNVVFVMRKIIQSLRKYSLVKSLLQLLPTELYPTLGVITLEDISKELSSIIEGVKFLIVLDDMFEPQWDVIHTILSRASPGSVVLITTENQVFANRVGTFGPIALSALDPDKFWVLFKHFVFGDQSNYWVIPQEKRLILKVIGKKIANKLRGLPLAAKIIGKILGSNVDEDRWRRISKSEWWNIPEGKRQILPYIGLGFEQLDPCLRQCFAYCSIFPRNSLIEKDRLVHMWIAQNFIQRDVNGVMTLEDIGRQWFDELVEKSFFQHAGDNNSYVMHELMNDLAVIVSSGECCYLGEGVVEIPLGVRHLTVDTNNLEVIKGIQKHKNLRSFLYFGCCENEGIYSAINDTLSKLGSIRVLDLSYMCMEYNYKPPTAIWNLQHLRFLDLSSTGIKILTHSSVDLYHLQSLYIRKCKFQELPRGINKLINLRHLYAEEETIAQISGIGQLTNLQELGVFVVGEKEGHRVTELRNLNEIRGTLRIENFENIKNKNEAKLANLVDKKHLDSIFINSITTERKSNVDMEVLNGLQPHKDIKDLRIDNYVGSDFPDWIIQIGYFLNLNALCLVSCVNVKVLPPLGELPYLKFLHIEELSSIELIDYHLYGGEPTVFRVLQELVLDNLSNCKKWTYAEGRKFFPCLSKLTITNTKTLKEAPLDSFCPSLKELIIDGCHSLISLENSISRLSSLTHLELCFCSASVTFEPFNMPLLENLYLYNCSELKIKGNLQSLSHLKHLHLDSCPKLFVMYSTKDQQKGKGLQVHWDEGLRSLTHVEADHSLLHHEYHLILGSLPSLRVLKFKYSEFTTTSFWSSGKGQCLSCGRLYVRNLYGETLINSRLLDCLIPNPKLFSKKNSEFTRFTDHQLLWFQELTTLQELHFSYCEFEHLPASLSLLSSLKKMKLISCAKLKSLSNSMPPNLQELALRGCSQNLVQLCQAYKGQDQKIISSIPVIHIDDYTNCKEKIPTDADKMGSMEIRRRQISDAIGRRACVSCGKTFEPRDLVLRDWKC